MQRKLSDAMRGEVELSIAQLVELVARDPLLARAVAGSAQRCASGPWSSRIPRPGQKLLAEPPRPALHAAPVAAALVTAAAADASVTSAQSAEPAPTGPSHEDLKRLVEQALGAEARPAMDALIQTAAAPKKGLL